MNHLSLFSGIGGFDIAAGWAGMQTVGFVERDPFCQKVLAKHWPNVPIFGDIFDVTGELIRERCGDVDILTGGFPCQPHSVAGKRKGSADTRFLWPQMLRVIKETAPRWCICENVAGILSDGTADHVCADLEAAGYTCWTLDTPACAFGLFTMERHIWIVAQANGERPQRFIGKPIPHVPHVTRELPRGNTGDLSRWAIPSSRVCGVAERIPSKVDRNRALGNSVSPVHVYPILKAIADLEKVTQ